MKDTALFTQLLGLCSDCNTLCSVYDESNGHGNTLLIAENRDWATMLFNLLMEGFHIRLSGLCGRKSSAWLNVIISSAITLAR